MLLGRSGRPHLQKGKNGVREYAFDVKIAAVIRANHDDEKSAREAVQALDSVSPEEISSLYDCCLTEFTVEKVEEKAFEIDGLNVEQEADAAAKGEPTNDDRARRVRAALNTVYDRPGADDVELVADLLVDLMHYCPQNDIDFGDALTNGRKRFTKEAKEEAALATQKQRPHCSPSR